MFFEPLTAEEFEFLEAYHDPIALIECLIPENIKAPHLWSNEDCKLVTLRPYQFAMQNYSYLYADDDSLKNKENFQRKKGAGDLINLAGRNEGKTFFLIIDAFLNLIHSTSSESCIASFDNKHLLKPCKVVANLINYHPFFQIFKRLGKKSVRFSGGGMEADTILGHLLLGKNEKVDEPDPGTDFHGLHYKTFWYEESSYMSKAGTEKRIDSGDSEGHIERLSGIPDIRIDSPLGKIILDPKKQNWICRLPQYVRCIAKGSKILMSNFSTKNIEDIKIGDEVFSVSKNKPHFLETTKVLNKICNGTKKTITITNNHNSLDLTSDHKLLTLLSPMYRTWKNYDELNLETNKIYYFKNYIQDMISYYEGCFLGILETEGSFKRNKREKSIGQKTEKKLLEFLLNTLNIKYTKSDDKKIKDFSYYYIKVNNTEYINKLYSKLELSKDFQLGFIAGCIYGDGCIHIRPKKGNTTDGEIIIIQKNKTELIERILKLANIEYTKRIRQHQTNFGYFDSYSFSFKKFEIPLCVPYSNKSLKYKQLCNHSSLMAIQNKEIKKINERISEVYDLTTENNSFIANGFIVHNCDWDAQSRQEAIEKYNGETSYGFKLNVEAEIIEGASNYWDMERLRKACSYGKDGIRTKFFEIDKNRLHQIEQILILDRLPCKQAYVCSDIGTLGSPSEIIILFYDGEVFKYHYNISLYKLSTFEQAQVFKFIYDKLGKAFIGLDCTNADGRSILDDLYRLGVPQEDLVAVRFNKNIEVDFMKNDDGTVQLDNSGQPIMKQEVTMDWAMQVLEKLFYNGKMLIPLDEKFIMSFSGIILKQIGTTRKIGSVNGEDHLHQSFQCFAITYFINEFKQQIAKPKTKRCLGTIG